MPETTTQTHEEKAPDPVRKTVPAWLVTVIILLLAVAIFFMVYGNWNSWQSNRASQETNDAYVNADITAVSTKAAGILQDLPVSDYQHVKKGQLLATIRSDDYQTQVSGAKAALDGTVAGLDEVRHQKGIADAKIAQANAGVTAAEGQVSAAKAGVDAAKASVRTADAGVSAAGAQLKNAQEERERAEGLYAVRATTLQKVQNVQAQATSTQALSDSRQSDRLAAQAQLELRTADFQRAQAGLISSRQDLEAALLSRRLVDAKEKQLRAEIAARSAALEGAKIGLGYTTIVAPTDGYIASRNILTGQLVSPGSTVVTLVAEEPWIQANFKETQLARMRVGDHSDIKIDAYPSRTWHGTIVAIAPATGAQTALIPPSNASGNFTKIVQRLPVKIAPDPDSKDIALLRPGLSAHVVVKVGSDRQ
jgi:membrane fusion protein (multidrug efflux system)